MVINDNADGRVTPLHGSLLTWRRGIAKTGDHIVRFSVPFQWGLVLSKLETRLGWTRERRQRIVLRLDGDFGITEVLNGCSTGDIRWSPRSAIVVGSGSCGRPWGR